MASSFPAPCFSGNFPLCPPRKKSPKLFPLFRQNLYICTCSKSKAKQRRETRIAPGSGLLALSVLLIN